MRLASHSARRRDGIEKRVSPSVAIRKSPAIR